MKRLREFLNESYIKLDRNKEYKIHVHKIVREHEKEIKNSRRSPQHGNSEEVNPKHKFKVSAAHAEAAQDMVHQYLANDDRKYSQKDYNIHIK